MASLRSSPAWRQLMHVARPVAGILPPSLYTHLWFEGPFRARVHGATFKMLHPGSQIENEVFWRNTFERERGSVLSILSHLREIEVMLDVGANTGFFSLLTKAINPTARVIALEPSPHNFSILQQNVALNGFDIECVGAAATDKDAEVTLHDFAGISYSASLNAASTPGTFERKVRGVKLDTLAHEQRVLGRPALIKIDVEGHEPQVLAGARELIASRPVFLVEILRDYVADGVRHLVSPAHFDYLLVDEEAMTTRDCTAIAATEGEMPRGNYLIRPRNEGAPNGDPR
jgi:FkbM family methyltransferase